MPDLLYLLSNFVRRRKIYVPTYKRKYSHSSVGLLTWTFFVFFVLNVFAEVFWTILITALAFIGYWLHLATDRVELFVDRVAEFFEKAVRE